MVQIIPGDEHYLGITAVVTVVMQLLFFAVAYGAGIDTVTDFAGSTNFMLLALLTLLADGAYTARKIAITSIVCVARLQLAGYLLYRVLKRGKDARFDEVRGSFWSFLVFWIFQMIWVWGVSLPVIFVNADAAGTEEPWAMGVRDGVGIAVALAGWLIEVVADVQKNAFRSDPANKGKWCDIGLWRVSRHPNFFGEVMLWWGVFILATPSLDASPTAASWSYAVIISPLLTMVILLLGSGIPTAEGDNQRRFMRTAEQKHAYLEYRNRTSPFIPLPPTLYQSLPLWFKRLALFELPMYETDWMWSPEKEEQKAKAAREDTKLTAAVPS